MKKAAGDKTDQMAAVRVPCNWGEGWKDRMEEGRVRIVDIAEELGLSTATVSNVIHGKTKKISDETVKRVEQLLEQRQYIPSMAGILLAQNNSRIIGVVVNDHEKYEGHTLEDGFIAASLNALSAELDKEGYFMMVRQTAQWDQIPTFASMWNMEGLVLIGFCSQDYKKLRERMHIPFVIYDGYGEEAEGLVNLTVDNLEGGRCAGRYLKKKGHQRVLCISDNAVCMDAERYQGLKEVLPQAELLLIPMKRTERHAFYRENLKQILQYSAVFAVSDYYAVDLMCFLLAQQIRIPEEISIMGFDDTQLGKMIQPTLTTIRQDPAERAGKAVELLKELKQGKRKGETIYTGVSLVERETVGFVQNA